LILKIRGKGKDENTDQEQITVKLADSYVEAHTSLPAFA